jgi:hypothetical protein
VGFNSRHDDGVRTAMVDSGGGEFLLIRASFWTERRGDDV